MRGVTAKVSLDRTDPDEVVFRYDLEVDGELTEEQRNRLFQASKACSIRKTLSKRIRLSTAQVIE